MGTRLLLTGQLACDSLPRGAGWAIWCWGRGMMADVLVLEALPFPHMGLVKVGLAPVTAPELVVWGFIEVAQVQAPDRSRVPLSLQSLVWR